MKAQVTRRGAGVDAAERRIVGHELAGASVEPVAHDLVDAFVVDQDALAGWVEGDEVRVRAFLGWPGPGALVLEQVGARSESTVGVDGEDRHTAVLVIGDDDPLAARVDAGGTACRGFLAIDRGQRTAAIGVNDQLRRVLPRPSLTENRKRSFDETRRTDRSATNCIWRGRRCRIDVERCRGPTVRIGADVRRIRRRPEVEHSSRVRAQVVGGMRPSASSAGTEAIVGRCSCVDVGHV
jgi:hypothetical protein